MSELSRRIFLGAATTALGYSRIIGANDSFFGRDAVLAVEAKAVWYATHFLSLCDFDQTAQPSTIRVTGSAVSGGLHLDQIDVNADD